MILGKISENQLKLAAAQVREAMLSSLPEPQDCAGQFTEEFERQIRNLKQQHAKKESAKQVRRRIAAALIALLVGASLLLTVSPQARASVKAWIKKTFDTYTQYWFQGETGGVLPEYELTWIPEGYEMVREEPLSKSRTLVYQRGDDETDAFVVDYSLAQEDSYLIWDPLGFEYEVEVVSIQGNHGELYISQEETRGHCLIFLDEENDVVFTISAFLRPKDILHIADGIKLVN